MQDLSKYVNGGVLFDGHYRLIKLLSTKGGIHMPTKWVVTKS